MGKNRTVIQRHHISYQDPEITVPVYKGEHQVLWLIQRRKNISLGFIESLKFIIEERGKDAIALQ
jgi:hypothetical protein